MFNSNAVPFTMNVEPSGSGNNGVFNDGAYGGIIWILIIVLLFAGYGRGGFGGFGGFGGADSSVAEGYVLTNDFSNLSRQISDGFASTDRKGDSISNGLCDGFYAQNTTMLNGFNGIDKSIANSNYAIQNAITQQTIADMGNMNALTAQMTGLGTQLASCCCDLRYETATKFADLNYNIATQDCTTRRTITDVARDLNDNNNENTRAILAAIQSIKDDAKDEKIATLTAQLNESRLISNNNAQTAIFTNALNAAVEKLNPCPIPAYNVPAPFQYTGCGCNCNCNC